MRKQLAQILLLIIVVFISSCNKNTKRNDQEIVLKTKEKSELTVIIQFKSNKADNFKLSLNNIVVDEFQKKNVQIIERIEPSSGFDEISASFGESNISNNLVINFGKNNDKIIEIKSIRVSYLSKEIFINDLKEFNKYFAFNKYIELNSTDKIIIKTKHIKGVINPVLYSKKNLNFY